MSHAIDAVFATASQEALALFHKGQFASSNNQYKSIIAGICGRYSQQDMATNASIACILADFARVCREQALFEESLSLFESALNVLNTVAGAEHPVTMR